VPFLSFLASSGHFVFQFQSHTLNEAFLELFKYTPDVLHIYIYTKKDGTRAIHFNLLISKHDFFGHTPILGFELLD
jgi:hypothetical protein